MFAQSLFPDPLKRGEVAPIYKQVNSRLAWTNFRPVSVLTCLSKVFEIIMTKQMQPHLNKIFSIYLWRSARVLVHLRANFWPILDFLECNGGT